MIMFYFDFFKWKNDLMIRDNFCTFFLYFASSPSDGRQAHGGLFTDWMIEILKKYVGWKLPYIFCTLYHSPSDGGHGHWGLLTDWLKFYFKIRWWKSASQRPSCRSFLTRLMLRSVVHWPWNTPERSAKSVVATWVIDNYTALRYVRLPRKTY